MKFLSIKKMYYDQILEGTKTTEYRSMSARNMTLLTLKPSIIALHYYQANRLVCEVLRISIVKTPLKLRYFFGEEESVIAIKLGKIKEVYKV